MKAKVFTRTLKTAGWNSSFLVEQLKKYHFPEFVEIPFWADDFRKSNTSMRMELPPNEMTIRFYGGTTERHWEIRINEIELIV